MVRATAVLVGLALVLSACLPRDRLNTNCEWTKDPVRALDLSLESDRRHLSVDAKWLYVYLKRIAGDRGLCYRSVRSLARQTLAGLGYHVLEARNGADAYVREFQRTCRASVSALP